MLARVLEIIQLLKDTELTSGRLIRHLGIFKFSLPWSRNPCGADL